MLDFVDSHCHLHFPEYNNDAKAVYNRALASGVTKMITVGTNAADSQKAVEFATGYDGVWAAIGLHPHYAKNLEPHKTALEELAKGPKVVAIGECGLDYFYNHSAKSDQGQALRFQIELALINDLPLVFHIREAYDDFWRIFDSYQGLRAVAHCFSATIKELDEALSRDLYIGLNGIVTFSKNPAQQEAFKKVPLEKLLLETDAPLLTPAPFRGKVNEPKHVVIVAEFLSQLRAEKLEDLVSVSSANAKRLFVQI